LSQTKPFCDHSHRDGRFISEIKAYALDPPVPKS
jgi:CDGSH-type Zn-finger protein